MFPRRLTERCLQTFPTYVKEALDALNGGLTLDAVNVSIDCALGELMSLTGKRVTDETVNEVFAKFCVGK